MASKALGQIGPVAEAAIPALIVCLSDESGAVRSSAAATLGEIGPAALSAVPVLIVCLSDSYDGGGHFGPRMPVRQSAQYALQSIGTSEALAAIAEARQKGLLVDLL